MEDKGLPGPARPRSCACKLRNRRTAEQLDRNIAKTMMRLQGSTTIGQRAAYNDLGILDSSRFTKLIY